MHRNGFWKIATMVLLWMTSVVVPRAYGASLAAWLGDGQAGYDRGQWDAPPQEWNEYQRRGFQDGMDGARKDQQNHRTPDVDNRDEYRHPNVPQEMWGVYREGFRRGYDRAMSHLAGTDDWRRQAAVRPWDATPDGFNDVQRQGFRDGVEGARKDVDNHRRPDVNNRDEYRHPNVAPSLWGPYRDGFARGYQAAMSHLMSGSVYGGSAYVQPSLPWDAPSPGWNDAQQQGFQDGMNGARKDVENHRQPNVNNRDEYRHPSIAGPLREAYREGFREGYNRAMSHLMGGNYR
jgi:hypothetical protein